VSQPGARPAHLPAPGDYRGAIAWMRKLRAGQIARRPEEGLREHKKRITRQQISDTATWMFVERGFDAVRVADVAEAVGVSEKTVFNYFPTKESLVFDREEEITESFIATLRDRDPSTSPVQAVVAYMSGEEQRYGEVPAEALWMLRAFDELVTSTPALVAAARAMTSRIIAAVAEALAEELRLDPRDPEPQLVARALMALWETREASMSRRIDEGLAGTELREAVQADVARAARVLETGLWALHLIAQGRQVAEAARSMDDARREIAGAVRKARQAWRAARSETRDAKQRARREVQQARRDARRSER